MKNQIKNLNTVREIKEMFSMIGRLIGTTIDSMLSTLSIIILVGRLLTKPVEIAIALLKDIRNLRTLKTVKKNEETKKEAEPEKGSSSSFSFALFSPCITEVMIT